MGWRGKESEDGDMKGTDERVMEDGGCEQGWQSDKVMEDRKVDKGQRTEDGVMEVVGNRIRKTYREARSNEQMLGR